MRIVHVVGELGVGGDTSAIFNVLKNNKDMDIHFDFITHPGFKEEAVKWCRDFGSNVYVLKGDVRQQGIFKYYSDIKELLIKEGKFDAIHMHTSMQSGVGLWAAKDAGIKKRITHSHVTTIQRPASKLQKLVAIPVFRYLINKNATDLVACSKAAGKYLFGDSSFTVVNNGINTQAYMSQNENNVSRLRKEFDIGEGTIVVGHVGRLCKMKNQAFVIELAKLAKQKGLDMVFLLVGDGEDKNLLESLIKENKLEQYVRLAGRRNNIPDFMHLFDVFLLPSLLGEGLPVVLIEAQVAGCFCISSDLVTMEADIGLNIMRYNSLNSYEKWIQDILSFAGQEKVQLSNIKKAVEDNKLDQVSSTEEWLRMYKI